MKTKKKAGKETLEVDATFSLVVDALVRVP